MFAIGLLAILFAQGNALINGDGSPMNPQPMTVEMMAQERVNAFDAVLTCTRKVMDNTRVNCDRETQHYNDVSAKLLDMERELDNAKLTDVKS